MGEIGENAMQKIDESFLESIGITGISDTQKEAFLQYAQDQLEIRIGEKMSESLSDEQLDEFERVIDNEPHMIRSLLQSLGDYRSDEVYQTLKRNTGAQDDDMGLISDYVTAKWLNQNCPQYQQIIKDSLVELQNEIREQKDGILAAA
jgi:hypothetical protein